MSPSASIVRGTASFDRSGRYRYALTRVWDPSGPRVAFVMLNPNRADARSDDPTIRRCIRFARDWGFGSLEVVNLFAWRARHPRDLRRVPDPVGPRDDLAIRRAAGRAERIVAAWGTGGALHGRAAAVTQDGPLAAHRLWCLGTTAVGHPRHPLYVAAATRPRVLVSRP